jgi:hypothetical protein
MRIMTVELVAVGGHCVQAAVTGTPTGTLRGAADIAGLVPRREGRCHAVPGAGITLPPGRRERTGGHGWGGYGVPAGFLPFQSQSEHN